MNKSFCILTLATTALVMAASGTAMIIHDAVSSIEMEEISDEPG